MKKLLFSLILFILGTFSVKASHLMGGEITYTHVSGDDYLVVLGVYRDCSGIDLSDFATVDFTSSCGTFSFDFDLDSTVEVSQLCASSLGSSTCNGGSLPGTQKWVYSQIVTLPPCADWVISWTDGSRNPGSTNLQNPDLENIYIEATLNNILGAFNSSPQYIALPTPYLCANQLNIFNHGASDVDGDSLYYQFAQPLSAAGTPIAFTAGYSVNDPILTTAGMNLNPETGEMCFTPSQAQICVVSVLVSEYRNNVLIGTQIREMQVVVSNSCGGNIPPTAGGGAAVCGGGGGSLSVDYQGPSVTQLDGNSFVMCPNDSLCFTIPFADVDGDNVSIITNIGISIPTANFSISGNNTTNAELSICWVPTSLDSGINIFTIEVRDDACPISAFQYYTYDITVFDQPYAGPDQTICGPQTATLQALGGGGYTWSVLSGDTDLGHMSCTSCETTIVDPDVTTTYLLTSSLAAACENTDTVIVNRVPDFDVSAYGDTILCDYISTPIGVEVLPSTGAYTYLWDNTATVDNVASPTPNVSPDGTTNYIVTITSPFGCVKQDSVQVGVNPPPALTMMPGDTTICVGETLNFGITTDCQMSASVTGQDSNPGTDATVNDFSCANGATITSMTLDAAFVGTFCPSWYTYDIIINGVTQFTQQCNQTGLDLTPFLPITSVTVSANDEDAFSDNVTLNMTINIAYTLDQLVYTWSPTTNLSNPSISNPVLSGVDSTTTYVLTMTDTASGCSFDRSMVIVPFSGINPVASPDTVICEGQQVILSVDSISSSCTYTLELHDSWGDGWNGATIDIFVNGMPFLSNQTVPDCNGTTATGCTSVFSIPVSNGDVIVFDYTSGSFNNENTITLLDGDGVEVFSVNDPANGAIGPFTVDCSGGVSFSWSPAINLSDSTSPNPIFTGVSTSTYTVEVYMTDRPACNGFSQPITIEVSSIEPPIITGDSAICYGESVTYQVTGASSITWPDGSSDSVYTFTPQNDSLINVTAATGCGTLVWNKHIVVYPEISLTATPDTIVCAGQSVNINLNGILNECTYLLTLQDAIGDGWNGGESVTVKINGIDYEVGMSVASCGTGPCSNSLVIPVNNGDVITIEYTSGSTDAENTILLYDASNTEILNVNTPTSGILGTFNADCSNAYTINWTPASQLSDPTIVNPVFNAIPATTYSYQATVSLNVNPVCQNISNIINIQVNSVDTPAIIGDSIVCWGTPATLNIPGSYDFLWLPDNSTGSSFTFYPEYDSLVQVQVSNFCIDTMDLSQIVYVNPLPIINTIPDTIITIQSTVELTTTGGTIYSWSPNVNLSCNDCPNPVASPTETTTYYVTVTDSNGCVSNDYVIVNVVIPDLFIPTGFSPNGDGYNDEVLVRSLSIVKMNLQIYDRWGNLVFESNDQAKGWDGTSKGVKCDAGVYIYKFEAKFIDGEKLEQSGNITLFR
ncbi:MAG: gliding motility-associated C-terminal domain-containing protein [Flavobacteriales bacterium]|nr:gliding motility-associated C-terminal domain-containing protein [Flavobacteriales bacterium]